MYLMKMNSTLKAMNKELHFIKYFVTIVKLNEDNHCSNNIQDNIHYNPTVTKLSNLKRE